MASLLRTDKEITEIYHRNVDTVYRICYSFMKNKTEAEDMVQETFLRLISAGKTFQNLRHEKAWLIVTASNLAHLQYKCNSIVFKKSVTHSEKSPRIVFADNNKRRERYEPLQTS